MVQFNDRLTNINLQLISITGIIATTDLTGSLEIKTWHDNNPHNPLDWTIYNFSGFSETMSINSAANHYIFVYSENEFHLIPVLRGGEQDSISLFHEIKRFAVIKKSRARILIDRKFLLKDTQNNNSGIISENQRQPLCIYRYYASTFD